MAGLAWMALLLLAAWKAAGALRGLLLCALLLAIAVELGGELVALVRKVRR